MADRLGAGGSLDGLLKTTVRCLALALVFCAAAPAASAQVSARLADLRLATAVRLALVDDVRTRALDLDVVARNGAVEVDGEIPAQDRRTVGEVARAVTGVRSLGGVGALVEPAGPVVSVPERPTGARPGTPERRPEAAQPDAERPASGPVYHTVGRGDTLFSLARRYDTTVEVIRDLNDLRGTDIRAGQRLRVR